MKDVIPMQPLDPILERVKSCRKLTVKLTAPLLVHPFQNWVRDRHVPSLCNTEITDRQIRENGETVVSQIYKHFLEIHRKLQIICNYPK